ncbi:MAG: ATP-binding cassette domain-containing protein [Sedimentibacter saalensis]|uniref:ATP-binding cassette domain-containing protein n=1 Tax=Sedimentibacter saalensis TaxID=130788 RepID=UPI002B208493|nr:ATP-binding cassette domain-containing protein [Sedimentibacter saalensis]MEA5093370.1 ATP-binding cassette domain-containing protein [Sedimentibacter saalensis]
MENGLDTKVTSDTLFLQGQKQLLAIARAIVTKPPVLLLDEITANLDSITEEKIVSVL